MKQIRDYFDLLELQVAMNTPETSYLTSVPAVLQYYILKGCMKIKTHETGNLECLLILVNFMVTQHTCLSIFDKKCGVTTVIMFLSSFSLISKSKSRISSVLQSVSRPSP